MSFEFEMNRVFYFEIFNNFIRIVDRNLNYNVKRACVLSTRCTVSSRINKKVFCECALTEYKTVSSCKYPMEICVVKNYMYNTKTQGFEFIR